MAYRDLFLSDQHSMSRPGRRRLTAFPRQRSTDHDFG